MNASATHTVFNKPCMMESMLDGDELLKTGELHLVNMAGIKYKN